MANEEHVGILKRGVEVWNKWRELHPEIIPDLSGADRRRADLRGADLRGADLRQANLSQAALSGADLSLANLSLADLSLAFFNWSDLSWADLSWADLSGADLSGVDLSRAALIRANLSGADLAGMNISSATIGWTILGDIDLSSVNGLETVQHEGPSTIGVDTIYKSKGNIPHKFLLDSGMPQEAIDYLLPLAGKAIDFYSCFISYSTKDQAFAERLHADLQAKGVRCWYAPEDIQGGKKIHEQIDQAIRVYDKLLVILSAHSMNSEWVKTEVYNARQQEVEEKRRKLFPLSLVVYETVRQWRAFDADIGKDMARDVREYFIPDFTNWKDHDAYQKAFDRLLRDLKAKG